MRDARFSSSTLATLLQDDCRLLALVYSSDSSLPPFRMDMDRRNTGNQGMVGPSIQLFRN